MKHPRHPLKAVQPDPRPAVTVTDISDPASVRDGMEVLDQDVVHLEKMLFRARRVMVRLTGSMFSRAYKACFGELPSETLKRARAEPAVGQA